QTGFTARPGRPLPPRGEFVIRGATVLTIDGKIGDFPRGDVHVRNGAIVAVAESINSLGVTVLDGAVDLGIAARVGSLTPAKRADLILVRTSDINITPLSDPYEAL